MGARVEIDSIDELISGRGKIIIFSHEIIDRNKEYAEMQTKDCKQRIENATSLFKFNLT